MDEIKEDEGMAELSAKAEDCDKLMLQIAELQEKADAMKKDLLAGILDRKLTGITASNGDLFELQVKTKYAYKDEESMIAWMKANGYGKFVKEKISAASFNAAYKSGKDANLTESMHPMMQASTTQELHFVTKESRDKSCLHKTK